MCRLLYNSHSTLIALYEATAGCLIYIKWSSLKSLLLGIDQIQAKYIYKYARHLGFGFRIFTEECFQSLTLVFFICVSILNCSSCCCFSLSFCNPWTNWHLKDTALTYHHVYFSFIWTPNPLFPWTHHYWQSFSPMLFPSELTLSFK